MGGRRRKAGVEAIRLKGTKSEGEGKPFLADTRSELERLRLRFETEVSNLSHGEWMSTEDV
jgi:hypothetical protein